MSSIQIFITTNMYILHIRMRAAQSGQYCRHPSTHTVPAHIWPPILFIIDCICAIRGSESIYRKPMHIALCNGFCWRVSIYRAFYTGEMFFIMWTHRACTSLSFFACKFSWSLLEHRRILRGPKYVLFIYSPSILLIEL